MNTIVVLGDAETVLAFALGGMRGYVAQSLEQAQAAWRTLLDDDAIHEQPALVLMTHAVAALLRDDVAQVRRQAAAPLVLEMRGFAEPPHESGSATPAGRMLGVGR